MTDSADHAAPATGPEAGREPGVATAPGGALARKLRGFVRLGPDEIAAIDGLVARRRRVAAGTELAREGQAGHRAFVVREGWACSYKLLSDGGRQVVDFQLPGDFMGLRSVLLRVSDHGFAAITDIVVAEITAGEVLETFQRLPRLGAAVLWAASRDEAMVVEHLVGVGRRSALARTAHLFVELGLRVRLVGLGTEADFACPLSQYLLADALGLTAIHLNRVLRQLREARVMTFRDGRVVVHDPARLRALGGPRRRGPSGLRATVARGPPVPGRRDSRVAAERADRG
jgi:CRP-like cAMP-binding protein